MLTAALLNGTTSIQCVTGSYVRDLQNKLLNCLQAARPFLTWCTDWAHIITRHHMETYRESMTGHYHRGSRWSSSVIWSVPIHYSSRSGRQRRWASLLRETQEPHLFSWAKEMPCSRVEWITRERKQKSWECERTGAEMNDQADCKSNYKSYKFEKRHRIPG